MAFQTIGGLDLASEPPTNISLAPAFSSTAFAATGDKVAWCGRFWHKDRTAKDITRGGFRFGTVTKSGGSALTFSLQDIDLANGPTIRPDEAQDQTVAIANGDSMLASNTWCRTGILSANRTVAPGEWLAAVLEFDGLGRLGSDSIGVASLNHSGTGLALASLAKKAGGSWSAEPSVIPNIIFECTDGTFGTLMGARPCSGVASTSFKQDTGTADEHGLGFQVPYPVQTDQIWIGAAVSANTSNFDAVIYDGTTAIETVAVDANATRGSVAGGQFFQAPLSQLVTFQPGTQYYIEARPNQTTSTIVLYSIDVFDPNHLQCWWGGPNFCHASRLDLGGTWTPTTTRRPLIGFGQAGGDDGAGSGGQNYSGGQFNRGFN